MAINSLYVDSVDEQKLVEDAIRGMIEKLDPHSAYSTPKETQAMNEPLQGSFEGIGVQFNIVEDTLLVIQPVLNGPSEKAGILPGDRIVTVNDTTIAGVKMHKDEIMRRLRGPKGTKVQLGIRRHPFNQLLPFNVTRDKIPVHTIDAAYTLQPGVAYIRIGSFGATTHDEFIQALHKLNFPPPPTTPLPPPTTTPPTLILDLQDNGGGYLQAAVQIANEFLNQGQLIVYTQGRATPRQDYHAKGNGILAPPSPLGGDKRGATRIIVLVNEYTASAAEILAGALQDQDRATIIGRRTFGKGLVQRPIEFADHSMIRLTVAHYYTPSGRSIQKPYVKGQNKAYQQDIQLRLKNGELTSPDTIPPHTLREDKRETPFYTLQQHRPVYAAGGITPDILVPLDTTQYTPLHRQLAAHSIIINANLQFVDQNRQSLLQQYPTFQQFQQHFQPPTSLIQKIKQQAQQQNINIQNPQQEWQQTLPMLNTQLKALIARDLWDMTEYFAIINQQNHILQRAIKEINKQ